MDDSITKHLKAYQLDYELHGAKDHISAIKCKNILLKDHQGAYYFITTFPNKKLSIESLKIFIGVPSLEYAEEKELQEQLHLSNAASSILGFWMINQT